MTRNSLLIRKCFRSYLLPMILLVLGSSLSEFVDSLIMGNLLGEYALAVINACMSILLIYTLVAFLFGMGGSIVYATLLGQREPDKANRIFTSGTCFVAGLSVLLGVLIFVAAPFLAGRLISDQTILPDTTAYIRMMALIGLPFTFLTCATNFLTASGNPRFSTVLVVMANLLNLGMDVVAVRILHMGVEGAAMATGVGYLVASLVLLAFRGRTQLRFCKVGWHDFRKLVSVCGYGASSALGQLGLTAKLVSMNYIAGVYASLSGQVVVSVCFQSLSIVSLIFGGILQAYLPIVATLQGEEDYKGIRMCVDYALRIMVGLVGVLTVLFVLFPVQFGYLYHVRSADAIELEIIGLRWFAVMHFFRSICLFVVYYYTAIGQKGISIVLCTLDAFLVVPLSLLMSQVWGIQGLFAAYAVNSVICLLAILPVTGFFRKDRNLSRIMFLPKKESCPVYNVTIKTTEELSARLSEEIEEFLLSEGIRQNDANFSGILAEELSMYILSETHQVSILDVLIRVYEDRIAMNFRNDGHNLSALKLLEEDDSGISNRRMIQKLASKLEYARLLGMNSVIIELRRNDVR